MVLNKEIINYIPSSDVYFEKDPLEKLATEGNLMAYKHKGFWYAMDTLKNKQDLEEMWAKGNAPWKLW